jgi:hypothetical protein
MAGERPDYNKLSAIQGLDGTTLRVVAVDASGRIIMLPYGVLDVIGTVDVNQIDSTRTVQGIDGAVLRTLVVDASGRLIMVPIGASGNYMSVDANGYLSSVMKGIEGANLRTIAVDASGNIIGILKGDYMGAVKTLAVDAQGRMLAVLTDPEDVFGNPHYMGSAELAARLGSIDTFDRRGQVIFMDDFESGTLGRWTDVSFGPNSKISLSTAYANRGAFSAKFVCGEAVNDTATMLHYMCYPVLGKIGLEAAVEWHGAESFRFCWQQMLYTGAKLYYAFVRLDINAETLSYLDSAGAWQVFASGIKPYAHMFRNSKLVVDFLAEKFVRFTLDATEYDLSAYGLRYIVSAAAPGYVLGLAHSRYDGAVTDTIYIDDIIVTVIEG